MNFEELDGYKGDLKGLLKKYKSLPEDVEVVKKVLITIQDEKTAPGFLPDHSSDLPEIVKVRRIACKSLKGSGVNSGLCLVYAYLKDERKIVMIGLYDKNVRKNKDIKSMLGRFDLYPGGFNPIRL